MLPGTLRDTRDPMSLFHSPMMQAGSLGVGDGGVCRDLVSLFAPGLSSVRFCPHPTEWAGLPRLHRPEISFVCRGAAAVYRKVLVNNYVSIKKSSITLGPHSQASGAGLLMGNCRYPHPARFSAKHAVTWARSLSASRRGPA